MFIRLVPTEGDIVQGLQALDNIKVYPLSNAGQEEPITFHFLDVTNVTLPNKLLEWEDNLEYWQ